MIPRAAKKRLIAFIALAVISIMYVLLSYVDLFRILGFDRYTVSMDMANGAGLYENAAVTVRGVQAGKVKSVAVTPQGVIATLQLDNAMQIPRGSRVDVRSVSAVGEQYVDFRPTAGPGPMLADGDTIPQQLVSLPVPTANLLGNVNRLVDRLPVDKLNTTLNELDSGFAGSGGDIQRLLDSGDALRAELAANLDPTRKLIGDLQPVLDTAERSSGDTHAYASQLAGFTGQLAQSDGDVRGTVDKISPFVDEARGLVNDLRPTVPLLLDNLTKVGQVTTIYVPNAAQTVTVLQAGINNTASALYKAKVPGTININFRTNVGNPPACTQGFEQDSQRLPQDLSPTKPATGAYCKVPEKSAQSVRGARHYPCPPGSPEKYGNNAFACGLFFQSPEEEAKNIQARVQTQMDQAYRNPKTSAEDGDKPPNYPNTGDDQAQANPPGNPYPYDPTTGVFVPNGGQPMVNGNAVRGAPTPGWAQFLTAPLAIPGR